MHKDPDEARVFVEELLSAAAGGEVEVAVFPPFPALTAAVEVAAGKLEVGAQNMHWEDAGAFTGEVSPSMLKAVGCRYVIIGHSERRLHFGETDEMVNRKLNSALKYGLKPIFCVGEVLSERESGQTKAVVARQLQQGLRDLELSSGKELVIAYEPVWAIGTGKTATVEDAEEVIKGIRNNIARLYGNRVGEAVRILYGGSVKKENSGELTAPPDIDGVLVGGASLKVQEFAGIIEGVRQARRR
ncbi:unnamed protein product [marine sediment metagenome]|uniref:triose-phosphate isomerase n=1 Tax=marine sediment metagenome TaxID=412755 RepID=X1R1L8_9ZZZZ